MKNEIPTDRASLNSLYRDLFTNNRYVNEAVSYNVNETLKLIQIQPVENRQAQRVFEEIKQLLSENNILEYIAHEYWLVGEAFVYAELNEKDCIWKNFIIQNPDYVRVKKNIVGKNNIYSLRPDENLRRVVFSDAPSDIKNCALLDKEIVKHVKSGGNIPLSNFYLAHIVRKISPYDIRGTSYLLPLLNELSKDEVSEEIQRTLNYPFCSTLNTGVGKEIFATAHKKLAGQISLWLIQKVFSPIAKLNDFQDYKDGEKRLILPNINNKMSST